MSLFNKIKQKAFKEFIDIIEWTDDTSDTMIWRFPRCHAAIKSNAQLTVRETQVAILVNEGQFADVFQPGRYQLTTNNMPILTTLKGWKYGFNSPFKVDLYFVNTKQFLNLRWGTANPIMMCDPEFGPIRIRAFGSYCFRVEPDPTRFIRNVAGTDGNFTAEGIAEQLRNFVITKFADYLAKSKIAALDLAANLNEFSSEINIALKDDFSEYGIELTKFLVESISLPEAVEESLDKRTSTAPPPMPPQSTYHVAVSGVQQGPFPVAQLQQMAQQGQLTRDTLVWTAGMAGWAAANSIPQLSQLFGALPPPL